MYDKILTPCEKSGYKKSADLTETAEYYRLLEEESPYIKFSYIGLSSGGNKIPFVKIESDESRKKVTLLIQNCIHPGEPEGNDATMILAREILSSENCGALLGVLRIIILPVFNPDGHKNHSNFNRVNQKGPLIQGWRTNDSNLNLNRDYMKADSEEIKLFLKIISEYKPDLFVDNHTTNGLDYPYHITYSIEKEPILSREFSEYAHKVFLPFLQDRLTQAGFLHTHYIELAGKELEDGLIRIAGLPRFSTGYMALLNKIGLLVETHSLKPFENRVKSTLEINRSVIEFLFLHHEEIKKKSMNARGKEYFKYARSRAKFGIKWEASEKVTEEKFISFAYETELSSITGSEVKRYTHRTEEVVVPVFKDINYIISVNVPDYYIVPQAYREVHAALQAHGFKPRIVNFFDQTLSRFRITSVKFADMPYEGRFRIIDFTYEIEKTNHFDFGNFYVYDPQIKNPRLLAFLLDPRSPDSFFQWGFFNGIFERKEYAEDFVFEPIAEKMLKESPKLRKEFSELLKDDSFRNNPSERLDFFYRKSVYFDKRESVYPVYFL